MIALARPLRVHRADSLRMIAFVMSRVLEVLDERLYGHGLQAERCQKKQRQDLGPQGGRWRGTRAHGGAQSNDRLPMMLVDEPVRLHRTFLLSTGEQDHSQNKKIVRMGQAALLRGGQAVHFRDGGGA